MSENEKSKFSTSSLRAYVMLAVLAGIWLYFHWATNSIFLTPRNLSNLATQMSVTGILAVGMLMVIVSGNIDLSVGSVLGFAGGIAAMILTMGGFSAPILAGFVVVIVAVMWFVNGKALSFGSVLAVAAALAAYSFWTFGYGVPAAIFFAISVGLFIGTFQGALTAYLNIPAFIVTLGGLLAWRGAVKWLLGGNTVPVADETFKAIGQQNIAREAGWVLAAIGIAFAVFMAYRHARSEASYNDGRLNYNSMILKIVVPVVGIVAFIWVMNAYQGVPIPVLIFVSVALIGAFITTSTVFGRYLYAIGGNADAARLSGIDIKRNILKVYALLGAFTGIAALIFTARVGSAAPDAGTLKELDAIAACVIGGASLMGGRGTVFGACIGALIMASLDNGMSLLNVRDFMQDIVKGSILVAAVGLDMVGRKQS